MLRMPRRRAHARRWPRLQHIHRPQRGVRFGRQSARRLHNEQWHINPACAHPTAQRIQVSPHERAHVRIDDGRRRAFVLLALAQDFVRERDLHVRQLTPQERADELLVLRIRIRVQEADRN